jgi:hypothetical protein
MLADEITTDLRAIRTGAIAEARQSRRAVTRLLTSKGIGYGSIKALPNGSVDTGQVRCVDADLRVRPFFAQGGTISIREFAVGAFSAEMGLEGDDPVLAAVVAGARVVTPSGMVLDGSLDRIEAPIAAHPSDDPDHDGVVGDPPPALLDHMEFYLLNYFKPGVYRQTLETRYGARVFGEIGCTDCPCSRCGSSTTGASPMSRRASIRFRVSSTTYLQRRRCVCPRSTMAPASRS